MLLLLPAQQAVSATATGVNFTIPSYPGHDSGPLTDPVVISTGKLYVPSVDVTISGPGRFNGINLAFIRSYNSKDDFNGVLGWGWVTNLDTNLSFSGGVASFKDGDGSRYCMQYKTSILFAHGGAPGAGYEHGPWTLANQSNTYWVLTKTFGTKYYFNYASPHRLRYIEDRQGHRITYNRNGAGQITSLSHSASQALTFTYNATTGRLWKVTDPLNRVWEYTQNGNSNLTTVTAPINRQTAYAYTDTDIHNITRITDPSGRYIKYEYFSSDQVSVITNPDSTTKAFTYDTGNNESTMDDEAGESWIWNYGNPGVVTELLMPPVVVQTSGGPVTQVREWQYEYSDHKKMTLMRDPKGREMKWEWDARQNLTKVIGREAGATWNIESDSAHHFPKKVTDALGHEHPAASSGGCFFNPLSRIGIPSRGASTCGTANGAGCLEIATRQGLCGARAQGLPSGGPPSVSRLAHPVQEPICLRQHRGQRHLPSGQGGAFEHVGGTGMELLQVALRAGLAIDFHKLVRGADNPIFRHAGFGVNEALEAVDFERRDRDFDDEFGGGGVGVAKVGLSAPDNEKVRLRLAVGEGHGGLAEKQAVLRKLAQQNVAQEMGGGTMER